MSPNPGVKAISPESPDAELYPHRMLDAIPQLAWRAYSDGSVEFCNQNWLEYTGLMEQQAQGWGWRAAIHPEDLDMLVAKWQDLLATGTPGEAEARMRAADGTYRWFLFSATPLRDDEGRIVWWYGTNTDIDERKRAEQKLRESEERLRMAAQAGRMYAYEWDVATDRVVRSAECVELLGVGSVMRTTRQELMNWVHPDDHGLCGDLSTVSPQNPILRARYRVGRQDGTWMWAEKTARAFFDDQGKMVRMIGMIADISERKLAEEALSTVTRRLIEAQEQERARIARELHDDLSQRIALLEISLEQFAQKMPELTSDARNQLHHISRVASEVSSDLHNMSHQLHPSKLDLLGLVATVAGYCREISAQQDVQIEFVHHGVAAQIPKDLALCLFRIVQEALRNVVKHSGAAEAKIELSGAGNQIDLCISDAGVGFDPDSAGGQAGLGLVSMRERLGLVGGHLSVESKPSQGSRIRVRVPLPAVPVEVADDGKLDMAGA